MPMVFGLIKMVRRSGQVKDIRAHIVYENEVKTGKFKYIIGDEETLEHEPILFEEKGPAVAAYAIARLSDGSLVREFMSAAEIEVVRRSSSAQKIYAKGKKPEVSPEPIGIWKDWEPEMWKKTVIRRICKRLDMSSEDMRRVMIEEDRIEEARDVTPQETPMQRKIREAREAEAGNHDSIDSTEIISDAETIDDPPPSNKPHWTESIDPKDAFPGSEAFTEGAKAQQAGMKREMCPETLDGQGKADWLGGFDQAGRSEE